MSEGVPSDVPQTQLAAGRTDVILLDWAGMVTASGHCAGENPVFLRFGTLPFPVEQNGSEIGIEFGRFQLLLEIGGQFDLQPGRQSSFPGDKLPLTPTLAIP